MLNYNEITNKKIIVLDGEPYEVLDSHVFRKQQRKPVNQTKLKNLMTGKVTERSFHQSETAVEADLPVQTFTYLYENRGIYWFCEPGNPKNRFSYSEEVVGPQGKFLRANTNVEALFFSDKLITFKIPVKVDLKVVSAPPAVRGNTVQGGTKQVTLENKMEIQVPLFIEEGDIVRVNTESGEYTERVEKK
ncbi:MAG: elongation factor P [Parcubacteria group bacterium]|nr:elongation factor P [Parcubacteria group bacterium]